MHAAVSGGSWNDGNITIFDLIGELHCILLISTWKCTHTKDLSFLKSLTITFAGGP